MNSLTAALCKKPVLGVAMWLATLCVTNQVFKYTFVDLNSPGLILSQDIDVPMDDDYGMKILLRPSAPPIQQARPTSWSEVACSTVQDNNPTLAVDSPRQSKVSLKIEVTSAQGAVLTERKFSPICPLPNYENYDSLYLGSIGLKRGKYRFRILNEQPLPSNAVHRVQVLLMGQSGGGFP
jgi:hypothetical protein